jgi:hypothetical protein
MKGKKFECLLISLFFNSACHAGHYEIVELLIKYKANVNIQSTSGNTALHYAAGGVRKKMYFSKNFNVFYKRVMLISFDCYLNMVQKWKKLMKMAIHHW